MGRITRNKELLSAYKSPDANTAVKRVLLDAMDNTAEYNNIKRLGQAYNQAVAPASATSRMAGTALDDFGIDISPDSKSKRSSDLDRVKLGDKDKRSFLAEEKLRIANGLVGGSNTREELVDMLNANGVQTSPRVLDAYNNDDRMNAVHDMDADNYFVRPEFESPSFVGEGQFGRVSELAPGYVSKTQEPLVEFGGYQMSEDGSMSPKGNLIGRIYDYRDVIDDANQLNYLNKKHITPKVENLIIDEDGSTEMIMKDLRTNYDTSQDYNDSIFNEYNDPNTSAPRRAQLLKDQNLYKVRQAQQEATAASAGIELQDRHQGNILINKMTKRPMQIDPSGKAVEGIERDAVIAQQVVNGLGDAGLTDEADIFAGLITEAGQRGDQSAIHDLAQQGMSRLMKIKKVL